MFTLWEKPVEQNQPQTSSAKSNQDTSSNDNTASIMLEALDDSLFGEEAKAIDEKEKEHKITTYQEWIEEKRKVLGKKMPEYKGNRLSFAQYAAALDDNIKQEILDSFDTEADYILQQEIAAAYKTGSMPLDQFQKVLKSMGYKVNRTSVQTNYIIDDKKDAAHHGGEYTRGNITMYTISDPQTGAEIKIIDSNGNAEIELEEIFLNELLEGVARDIDTSNFQRAQNINPSAYSNGELSGSGGREIQAEESIENSLTSDGKIPITQKQYDELKKRMQEDYIKNGLSKEAAFEKTQNNLQKHFTISDDARQVNISRMIEKMAS